MGSSASEPEASGYLKTQNLRFYREKIEGLEFRRKLRVRLCNARRPIDHDALETKANERVPYWVTDLTARLDMSVVRVSKYCPRENRDPVVNFDFQDLKGTFSAFDIVVSLALSF